jgi:RNA polymerase sigma-70 factor (ECF subfamily)
MENGSDAEDVVQQTLLKAFLHLGQFQSKARFSTWLIQIAIHEVLQRHRLRWSSRLVPLDQPALSRFQIAEETASPFKRLERMETNSLLRKAIAKLPEKDQAALCCATCQGVSITDAARLLGITVPAVKTRHQGARLKMAHSLAALASKARSCADIIRPT